MGIQLEIQLESVLGKLIDELNLGWLIQAKEGSLLFLLRELEAVLLEFLELEGELPARVQKALSLGCTTIEGGFLISLPLAHLQLLLLLL
mmetsp:Transcript_1281/g.1551  ORF Transcript_1281/g.1551 Transcript_1281/m.1551 type:complete len:90 (-) Transcript_1281:1432-1701(-)